MVLAVNFLRLSRMPYRGGQLAEDRPKEGHVRFRAFHGRRAKAHGRVAMRCNEGNLEPRTPWGMATTFDAALPSRGSRTTPQGGRFGAARSEIHRPALCGHGEPSAAHGAWAYMFRCRIRQVAPVFFRMTVTTGFARKSSRQEPEQGSARCGGGQSGGKPRLGIHPAPVRPSRTGIAESFPPTSQRMF